MDTLIVVAIVVCYMVVTFPVWWDCTLLPSRRLRFLLPSPIPEGAVAEMRADVGSVIASSRCCHCCCSNSVNDNWSICYRSCLLKTELTLPFSYNPYAFIDIATARPLPESLLAESLRLSHSSGIEAPNFQTAAKVVCMDCSCLICRLATVDLKLFRLKSTVVGLLCDSWRCCCWGDEGW